MSDQKNDRHNAGRQQWIEGKNQAGEDDFSRRAARGRSFLENTGDAEDLLGELDAAIDAAYSDEEAAPTAQPAEPRGRLRALPRSSWYAAAAAVVLLIVAAWWFTQPQTADGNLFADHFTHFEDDLVIRTMGPQDPTTDATLAAAMAPYKSRDYAAAIPALAEYLNTTTTPDSSVLLYLGISQLALNDSKAQQTLALARQLDYQPAAAQWYLALAALQAKDQATARTLLLELQGSPSLFREKATALLEKLN